MRAHAGDGWWSKAPEEHEDLEMAAWAEYGAPLEETEAPHKKKADPKKPWSVEHRVLLTPEERARRRAAKKKNRWPGLLWYWPWNDGEWHAQGKYAKLRDAKNALAALRKNRSWLRRGQLDEYRIVGPDGEVPGTLTLAKEPPYDGRRASG